MKDVKLTDAVVVPLMNKYNIKRDEAEKRLQLLYESNILQSGHPDDPETQLLIDGFLSQNSTVLTETVGFEKCFTACLSDESLIKEYDRLRPRAHMAYTMKQIEENKMNVKEQREAKKQFQMFEKFVREFVWSRIDTAE